MPTQDDLGCRLTMFLRYRRQHRVIEKLALPEGAPGFGSDSMGDVKVAQRFLLQTRMQLDLVDGGHDTGRIDDAGEMSRGEVRNTDRTGKASLLHRHQGAPAIDKTILLRRRPMDQIEIDIVELQLFQALIKRLERLVLALTVIPELGGDEEFRTRQAGGLDASAD